MSDVGRGYMTSRVGQDKTPNNMKSTQERLRENTGSAGGSLKSTSKSINDSMASAAGKTGEKAKSAGGRN